MKTIRIIAVSLFFSFIFLGCGEEPCNDINNPKCPNYDPCVKLKKTTASFKIYDYPGIEPPSTWEWEDTDTVGNKARFEADMTYDDVENVKDLSFVWKIGGGTYTGRTVIIGDGSIPNGKTITAMLIVFNSNVNKKCFPEDDGIDTFIRIFHTLPYDRKPAWFGIYRGAYEDNPKDSIDFVMHPDTQKINLPYQFCKNFGGNRNAFYTINTFMFPLGSWGTGDTNSKCFINSGGIFKVEKSYKSFELKIFKNENGGIPKDKIMHGRRLKSL